ncbi:hypothetical protein M419DRAFT_124234 [Trichoderma reesei RUT C-30]|uniref:Uncharacterized protein n=1 Tax=Hypocrea jecorina (strain ATCC 56765 / BCRC 32924 / NRRL 11460 / Rut C-30) TaxID=1344414 RepID=A0A024S677_HYPJR|nr:hypothetical protein M419DRAFT_124234 [Trichoderma reesei RUT C-30]
MRLLPRNAQDGVTRSDRCSRPKLQLLGSSLFRASLASSLVPRETIGEAEIGGPLHSPTREERVEWLRRCRSGNRRERERIAMFLLEGGRDKLQKPRI